MYEEYRTPPIILLPLTVLAFYVINKLYPKNKLLFNVLLILPTISLALYITNALSDSNNNARITDAHPKNLTTGTKCKKTRLSRGNYPNDMQLIFHKINHSFWSGVPLRCVKKGNHNPECIDDMQKMKNYKQNNPESMTTHQNRKKIFEGLKSIQLNYQDLIMKYHKEFSSLENKYKIRFEGLINKILIEISLKYKEINAATYAAHPCSGEPLFVNPKDIHPDFVIVIPYSTAIDPVTGTNWEDGSVKGVQPDCVAASDRVFQKSGE